MGTITTISHFVDAPLFGFVKNSAAKYWLFRCADANCDESCLILSQPLSQVERTSLLFAVSRREEHQAPGWRRLTNLTHVHKYQLRRRVSSPNSRKRILRLG